MGGSEFADARRIVIISPNAIWRAIMREVLVEAHYEVDEFRGIREAREPLADLTHGLLVLGTLDPIRDSKAFICDLLQADPDRRIIVFTCYDLSHGLREEVLALGARRVLSKALSADESLTEIRSELSTTT